MRSLTLLGLVLMMLSAAQPVSAEPPFSIRTESVTARSERVDLVRDWNLVTQKTRVELGIWSRCTVLHIDGDDCREFSSEIRQFDGLVTSVRNLTGRAQLDALHRAVKRLVKPASDEFRFGRDRWLSPFETLKEDMGDCEDYVFLERAVLLAAKFDPKALGVAFMESKRTREWHAILTIDTDEPLFLSNLVDGVFADLVNKDTVMDEEEVLRFYRPEFFFNWTGVWKYVPMVKTTSAR